MLLDGGERLVEAALDGLAQLVPQLLELREAPLEVLPLRRQLGESLLLRVVLLLGERVDRAECFPSALQADEPFCQRLPIVPFGRLGTCALQPPARGRLLGLEPGQLDVDRGRSLPRHGGAPAKSGLAGRNLAQGAGGVAGARAAGVDTRPKRCLEPATGLRRSRERPDEPLATGGR